MVDEDEACAEPTPPGHGVPQRADPVGAGTANAQHDDDHV